MPETPEGRRGAPPSLTASVTRTVPIPPGQGVPAPVEDEDTGVSPGMGEREERDTLPPGAVELGAVAAAGAEVRAPAVTPLNDVLTQAYREAEATRDGRRAADLWARVALLAWDLGDAEA